jgi:hypothetical protein
MRKVPALNKETMMKRKKWKRKQKPVVRYEGDVCRDGQVLLNFNDGK